MTDIDMNSLLPTFQAELVAHNRTGTVPVAAHARISYDTPDAPIGRMTLTHLVAVLRALPPEQLAHVVGSLNERVAESMLAMVPAQLLDEEKARADRAEQVLSQLKRTSPATAVLEEMLERNWCFGDLLTAMDADVTDRVALELLLLVGPTESNMRLGMMAEKLDRAFDVSPGFFANIEKEWLDSSEPKPLSPVVELAEARKLAESETKNA